MKIFDTIKLKIQVNDLTKEIEELNEKIEKLEKRDKEQNKNIDYLIAENSTLKQINRRKYLKYENKMKFLQDREIKLQNIEQMVKDGVDYRKVKKVIKDENN